VLIQIALFSVFCLSKDIPLNVDLQVNDTGNVFVSWIIPQQLSVDSVFIYRSHVPIGKMYSLDMYSYPITKTVIAQPQHIDTLCDSFTANNCQYFYYLKGFCSDGSFLYSAIKNITTPDIPVPVCNTGKPSLLIDKINYILELYIDSVCVKKFPVAMGGDPFTRKLHYDCLTTPEGSYKITYRNMNSSFYRSFGISYPGIEDKKRYTAALKEGSIPLKNGKPAAIGGLVSIHGGGVWSNWTWGCVAMKNEDIAQLIDLDCLKVGSPIYIVGKEFPRSRFIK
jgi:hypothetical protein